MKAKLGGQKKEALSLCKKRKEEKDTMEYTLKEQEMLNLAEKKGFLTVWDATLIYKTEEFARKTLEKFSKFGILKYNGTNFDYMRDGGFKTIRPEIDVEKIKKFIRIGFELGINGRSREYFNEWLDSVEIR